MDWETRLITLYDFICKQYTQGLWVYCQRFSAYTDLSFSDEEVMCIYLFGVMEKRREIKQIYEHTRNHLSEWFPQLPSYTGFVQRLNQIADVFAPLSTALQESCSQNGVIPDVWLGDSFPIKMAHAKRSGQAKVARTLASKGYCSSKDEYYYGVKVHVFGKKRAKTLPLPELIGLSGAHEADLNAFRQISEHFQNGEIYLDKAYADALLKQLSEEKQQLKILTPIKKKKGQAFLDSADQLFSTAVSRVRQPIESLFNWLEEKTGIQRASKVRSYNGLMVHVFGRIAAAMWMLSERAI